MPTAELNIATCFFHIEGILLCYSIVVKQHFQWEGIPSTRTQGKVIKRSKNKVHKQKSQFIQIVAWTWERKKWRNSEVQGGEGNFSIPVLLLTPETRRSPLCILWPGAFGIYQAEQNCKEPSLQHQGVLSPSLYHHFIIGCPSTSHGLTTVN